MSALDSCVSGFPHIGEIVRQVAFVCAALALLNRQDDPSAATPRYTFRETNV